MRFWAFCAVCLLPFLVWAYVIAAQKVAPPSRDWVRQMENYCEDLADAFERLESYHKSLAKEFRQAKNKRMAEIHERLADENDQVADRLNELKDVYEQLSREMRR
ncbi:MAG: hypothetical protein RMK94_00315 [Armatimonadota bacterium]|nr:hypothetical protein [Armatimonadota bacterium]